MPINYRASNHKLIVADPAILYVTCHTSPGTIPPPDCRRKYKASFTQAVLQLAGRNASEARSIRQTTG